MDNKQLPLFEIKSEAVTTPVVSQTEIMPFSKYIVYPLIIKTFFPEGCHFHQISDAIIYQALEKLNHRPRKC
mgnify:CR=1 FL=1